MKYFSAILKLFYMPFFIGENPFEKCLKSFCKKKMFSFATKI